jgi:hypothetical protein
MPALTPPPQIPRIARRTTMPAKKLCLRPGVLYNAALREEPTPLALPAPEAIMNPILQADNNFPGIDRHTCLNKPMPLQCIARLRLSEHNIAGKLSLPTTAARMGVRTQLLTGRPAHQRARTQLWQRLMSGIATEKVYRHGRCR